MSFNQPFFLLIFLPAAIALFYAAARVRGRTAALAAIVIASAVFYAPFGKLPAALLATSLGVNFVIGAALTAPDRPQPQRRALFALGLALDLGNLAVFKYLDQILAMAGPAARPLLAVAIPAGISFYTFHQAVFLTHAYGRQPEVVRFLGEMRGMRERAAALIRYAAFVALFPQLVIGPITYLREFGPQVERDDFGRPRLVNFAVGATLVISGLFKKVVIADGLARIADPLYHALSGAPIARGQAAMAVISYFFQLYFDFSGYSDMAVGIARLFGLRLPMNFDSPLRATGIVDFYRRWHMTLTRVIVALVFTPLSLAATRFATARGWRGWRARALSAWLPFLLTFEAIALWHGAKLTFVAFGLVHGAWYILQTEATSSRPFRRFRGRVSEAVRNLAGVALTAGPLALTFALFRSNSLRAFWWLLKSLAGHAPPAASHIVTLADWLEIAAAAVVVYALPNIYEVLRLYPPAIRTFENQSMTPASLRLAWRPTLIWAGFVAALAVIALTRLNLPNPFIYASF